MERDLELDMETHTYSDFPLLQLILDRRLIPHYKVGLALDCLQGVAGTGVPAPAKLAPRPLLAPARCDLFDRPASRWTRTPTTQGRQASAELAAATCLSF